MKLAVVANTEQKQELMSRGYLETAEIVWLSKAELVQGAAAYIDLLFEEGDHRDILIQQQQQEQSLILVSFVIGTAASLPGGFIRINGWNSFLDKDRIELAGGTEDERNIAEKTCSMLNRKAEWVADQIGFIAPRIIVSIINEAYLALQEGVSDKTQIDTAMKLGTNYPLGPFAWAEKIGLKKVHQLLSFLSKENARYQPAYFLTEEANN